MTTTTTTTNPKSWTSSFARAIVLTACGLIWGAVVLGQDNAVPIMSTDQLQAQLKSQTTQLQATIKALDDVAKAKTSIFDEVAAQYNADPSRKNWGKVYVAHFALVKDEATLLSKLSGLATEVNIGIAEDRQRKTVFVGQKERDLAEMMVRLDQVREKYQAATQRLSQATSSSDKEQLAREKESQVKLLEAEWGNKVEIETSIAKAKAGMARADDDAKAVSLLAGEIRSRRDIGLAKLKQVREKFERGQILGVDPALEGAKDNLGSLLSIVSGLSKSLEQRMTLPEQGESSAASQPVLKEQVMRFLDEQPKQSATNPAN